MDTEEKRALEANVMAKMIAIYCRGNNHPDRTYAPQDTAELCPSCRRLLRYADDRILRCPRMDVKSFCSACPIHCYAADMRAQIRAVMRYSGPRMLLHHPLMTFHHIWIDYKARKNEKKGRPS